MAHPALLFERIIGLPPVIVWDALVDADLVSGWLGEAIVQPEPGGDYVVRWLHRPGHPVTAGRVTRLQPQRLLVVETDDVGRWTFELEQTPGGSRGTSTALRLTVDSPVEPAFAPRVQADWLTNLDQLADLLAGHPVDWGNWGRDQQDVWDGHLGAARAGSA